MPVVTTAQKLRSANFRTMPQGLRVQIERENCTVEIENDGRYIRGRLFADFDYRNLGEAAELRLLAELAMRVAWDVDVEHSPLEGERLSSNAPKVVAWFTQDIRISKILKALDESFRGMIATVKDYLELASRSMRFCGIAASELRVRRGNNAVAVSQAAALEEIRVQRFMNAQRKELKH